MSSNRTAKKIRYFLRFIPDMPYIQINYFLHFGKFANLKNPKTYNEKINWLKIHDRNPIYTKLVDKYEVKKYIDEVVGGGYCIPTIGIYSSFDEIDFRQLPNQFVLKCTHDSEGLVIVKDKGALDIEKTRRKIEEHLKYNFYYIGREWPYKNVVPRIIAEPYIENYDDGELKDYKFFCFNGEPKAMYIAQGRGIGKTTFDFYDMNFVHLDIKQKYPNAISPCRKPVQFDEMIRLCRIISKDFIHIRVDFYEVDGKVYIGELTFFPLSGFIPFHPAEWDQIFGDWLNLSSDPYKRRAI